MLNNRQISPKRNCSTLAIPWCFCRISRAFDGISTSIIWQKYHPPELKHRPIFLLVACTSLRHLGHPAGAEYQELFLFFSFFPSLPSPRWTSAPRKRASTGIGKSEDAVTYQRPRQPSVRANRASAPTERPAGERDRSHEICLCLARRWIQIRAIDSTIISYGHDAFQAGTPCQTPRTARLGKKRSSSR